MTILSNLFLEEVYTESPDSDAYEIAVAKHINKNKKLKANRFVAGTDYSDVHIETSNGKEAWLEVKMNHEDNLVNTRFFYDGKKWDSSYTTPIVKNVLDELNNNVDAKRFIKDLKDFTGFKNPKLGSSKQFSGESEYVSLEKLQKFFSKRQDQYIFKLEEVDVAKILKTHLIKGKTAPANYIQTGDDFYLLDKNHNPLNLPNDIPILKGKGRMAVRIGMRSSKYEIQTEFKFKAKTMFPSDYSAKPGTKKKSPFEKYK